MFTVNIEQAFDTNWGHDQAKIEHESLGKTNSTNFLKTNQQSKPNKRDENKAERVNLPMTRKKNKNKTRNAQQ